MQVIIEKNLLTNALAIQIRIHPTLKSSFSVKILKLKGSIDANDDVPFKWSNVFSKPKFK